MKNLSFRFRLQKYFFSFSFLFLLFVNQYNYNTNLHVHRLSNGELMIHAHPYDHEDSDGPFQNHQHRSTEFVFSDQGIGFLLPHFDFDRPILESKAQRQIFNSYKLNFTSNYKCFFKNRPPPFA
jgi:hypothetical protein